MGRPSGKTGCIVTLILAGILGCGGQGDSATDNADRLVALYLYPPSSTQIPAQVVPYANVESDKDGIVKLDPGVAVMGRLVLPVEDELDGLVTDTTVSGSISASLHDTWLVYKGQTNYSTMSFMQDFSFSLMLPTGTYDLMVDPSSDDKPIPRQLFSDVYISPRTAESDMQLELDPGETLEVTLTDPEGNPIENAAVYTQDPATEAYSSSKSAVLGVGVYGLQVAHGRQQLWMGSDSEQETPLVHTMLAEIDIVEGEEPAPLTFNTYDIEVFRVVGHVLDSVGSALSSVTIYATRQSDGHEGEYLSQITTDSSGEFELSLPGGDYDLVFRPPNDQTELSGLRKPEVFVGSERDLGSITMPNRVVVDCAIIGPNGTAVIGASVTLVPDDRANFSTSALTDGDGLCTLSAGIGTYLLEIDPPLSDELIRTVLPISITSADSLGEIELEQGFTSTLQFLHQDNPVPDLVVQAWDINQETSLNASPVYQMGSSISDEKGLAELVLPLP